VNLDDVSLSDVEEASGPITPDDIEFLDNESVLQGSFIIDDDDTETVTGRPKAPSRLRSGYKAPAITSATPKSGIPTLDEWMDFFSRVLLRLATDFYIDWVFRGIDENVLSERDIERIKMTDQERDRIAKPFAEFAYKNKFARKHGREIIATAGSFDALLQLGLWYSRVSRIAARCKNPNGKPSKQRGTKDKPTPVVVIQPETESPNERPGPSAQNGTRFKPAVNGIVFRAGD
jgi:hypothetical protein